MAKISKDKYRLDIICPRDSGLALVKFCKDNCISVNSLINHLIVSFLLNKHKYAFNFVDDNEQPMNNQQNTIHADNDNEDDNENFPDIIKSLLDGENEGVDYSF
ncbi:hypothetical protein [Solidesulfovibrio alcoholivorans]|uniref:hypothetical protein n=1 Tax=Solidesulfovibrio alcoholivorans TaxID=81406 RepID=UPI0012EB3467|nr:hypothetical protein [Solidesulfovibrio alcoholivorans]